MNSNVFEVSGAQYFINRINQLTKESQPNWGKMSVDQMLAHCNVTYELVYENKHPKPTGLKKWLIKTLVKNTVVSDKPYKHNSPTSSEFKISSQKDFDTEKERLISYIERVQKEGKEKFEGLESHSFGPLTSMEWNNMFSKHLDHHLNQFGV